MKTILFLFIFSTIILSQSNDDYLSIAVVSLDSIVIPVGRFVGNDLINIQNNVEIWNDFETNILEWNYYPFNFKTKEWHSAHTVNCTKGADDISVKIWAYYGIYFSKRISSLLNSKITKLHSGQIVHFINGDDEIFKTYGFNLRLSQNNNLKFTSPNIITGFASNKPLKIYQKVNVKLDDTNQVIRKIPTSIFVSSDIREQLNKYNPNAIFGDTIKSTVDYLSSITTDSTIYYNYQTIYFLNEPYVYDNYIMNNGWILERNSNFELFPNGPFLIINAGDDHNELPTEIETLGVILYNKNLYFINKEFKWKSVYYRINKLVL